MFEFAIIALETDIYRMNAGRPNAGTPIINKKIEDMKKAIEVLKNYEE